jgi:hypothetical protein
MKNTPESWKANISTLERDDGVELWVGNGRGRMCLYKPHDVKFNFWERRLAWKAYEAWIRAFITTAITRTPQLVDTPRTYTIEERVAFLEDHMRQQESRLVSIIHDMNRPNPVTVSVPVPSPTSGAVREQIEIERVLNAPLIIRNIQTRKETNRHQALSPTEMYFEEIPDAEEGK